MVPKGFPNVTTSGRQYNIGEKPSVILYTYIGEVVPLFHIQPGSEYYKRQFCTSKAAGCVGPRCIETRSLAAGLGHRWSSQEGRVASTLPSIPRILTQMEGRRDHSSTTQNTSTICSLFIPPKRFDIFSPITGGCSEGLGVV